MFAYILYCFIIVLSILIMEGVAILTHKYIMHGPGWFLHKSHHSKHSQMFELNDIYFLIFSTPSIFCIIYGLIYNKAIVLSIGIGILCYGLIYLFLHDMFVHKRFGSTITTNNSYLKKIKKAHLKHHSTTTKNGATKFGFITY